MIFKNLSLYRITKALGHTQASLIEALEGRPFVPCGSQDWSRRGFVPPVDRTEELTLSIGNCHLVALKIQEKVLPGAAVAEALSIKVKEIEEKETRIVGRKERKQIKEQVVQELLPRALTKSKVICGYLDFDQQLLAIDTASPNMADEYIGALRDALDTMPVVPMETQRQPSATFATWVLDQSPEGLELNGACSMADPESKAKVSVSEHDLSNEAFCNLLHEGHVIDKLSLRMPDEATFTLSKDLRISKFKFFDKALMAGRSEDNETAADVARADFLMLFGTVNRMLSMILSACGGEVERKPEPQSSTEQVVNSAASATSSDLEDDQYPIAVEFVIKSEKPTISAVQRELRIGYNRAARLIERMEAEGVVSQMATDGSRVVLRQSAA